VLGVTTGRGRSDYTEIFLRICDCTDPVCRLTLGLDRAVSPQSLRAELLKRLDKVGNGRESEIRRQPAAPPDAGSLKR